MSATGAKEAPESRSLSPGSPHLNFRKLHLKLSIRWKSRTHGVFQGTAAVFDNKPPV